jgi:hypothetical protein
MKEELTTKAVEQCAAELKEFALRQLLMGSKVTPWIRNWMGEQHGVTGTTVAEMEQAVRLYFGDRFWEPRKAPRKKIDVVPVEFTPNIG